MSTVVMEHDDSRRLSHVFRDLIAGGIVGFMEIVYSLSFASLIFNGELEQYLPIGVGIALITAIVNIVIVSTFSRSPRFISSIQDNPAVLLSIIIGSIIASISIDRILPTVLALIFVSTASTGLFLFIIGRFKLGGMARFVPYPVIGGFLAGTGWLLIQGSFGIMSKYLLTLDNLPILFQTEQLILWIPGVIFGIVILVMINRIPHFLTLPAILFAGLVLFFLVLFFSGVSIAEATEHGYFVNVSDSSRVLPGLRVDLIFQSDWMAIAGQTGNIAALALVTFLSTLLNISGLELALKEDVDLDHELQVTGIANMLSAASGGMIGYHQSSVTMLGFRIGGQGRIVGILAGLACVVVLMIGAPFLAFVPGIFLGGIIFFLGFDFFYDWVIVGWRKFPTHDYIVVVLIVLTIAFAGFLIGVAVGLILAIVLFVYNYSRTDIFQHVMSGAEISSSVERSAYHEKSLLELGKEIHVMELRGFIFFGTVNRLLDSLRQRINDPERGKLSYAIFDFKRVTGIDSSAVLGFEKLSNLAASENFMMIFTAINQEVANELRYMKLSDDDEHIKFMDTLDHALGWCEDSLIYQRGITEAHIASSLKVQLQDMGFDSKLVKPLKTYLEKQVFQPGETLMRQDEDANTMYFIEIGQVSIFIEDSRHEEVQIHRTLQMGTSVGEMGFYQNRKRTASVVADTMTIAYCLSRDSFERMKEENPALAIALNELLVLVVADRLTRLNKQVIAMNR